MTRKEIHTSDDGGDIQSVTRVGRILSMLRSGNELTVSAVMEELGLLRPTAYRYLASLSKEGFLRHVGPGTFTVGPALQQIAIQVVGSSPVGEAGPFMRALVEDINQTVVLGLWGGDAAVVSRVEEDDSRLIHISVRVGSTLPLDSAQSIVFLANMSYTQRERLLARLPSDTLGQLEASIELAAKEGYGVASRTAEGVRALATPVYGSDGRVEATLAVVGTAATVPEDPDSGVLAALKATAENLSRHRGSPSLHDISAPAG